MTDPILTIVCEMEAWAAKIYEVNERLRLEDRVVVDGILDWTHRITAYWTPERRAFVEAAEGWGANSVRWDGAVGAAERGALRKEAHEICVRMDALYRAKIEAEKGEK